MNSHIFENIVKQPNSYIFENIVKQPNSYNLKLPFHSFVTISSKLQTPQVKYLPKLLIVSLFTEP